MAPELHASAPTTARVTILNARSCIVTAAAFQMFDTGGELKDICVALQITATDARRLYRDWQSSLDDPEPTARAAGRRLLDEDPRAEEAFARLMFNRNDGLWHHSDAVLADI